MKTRAAVLRDVGKPFEVVELDLDEPKTGEVLVRFAASGLCHSDDHLRTGDIPVRYPIVGGHEGAGVVEQVGIRVTRLAVGDHVVASFLPVCGKCRFCARGQTNLCDYGKFLYDNCLPDGTFRYHEGATDFGQMCLLGTSAMCSTPTACRTGPSPTPRGRPASGRCACSEPSPRRRCCPRRRWRRS